MHEKDMKIMYAKDSAKDTDNATDYANKLLCQQIIIMLISLHFPVGIIWHNL